MSAHAASEIVMEDTHVRAELKRRHLTQNLAFGMLWAAGGLVIVVLAFIIGYLLVQSGKFFIGPENLTEAATTMSSDAEILDAVRSQPGALGYASVSALDGSVHAIALNGVMPSTETVANGTYPVVQRLYGMTHGEVSPLARAWSDFVMSQEGQQVVEQAGFVSIANGQPFAPAGGDLTGELTIATSSTMAKLAQPLADAFNTYYPNVTVNITVEESTAVIKDAGKGNVDVGMSSREVRDYELVRYAGLNVDTVAEDGIAIVANNTMPVASLSINQVRDAFTGSVTNWRTFGGPDIDISVVSYESGTGAWDGFDTWILAKNAMMVRGIQTGDPGLFLQNLWASVKAIFRFLTTRPQPGMGGKGGISTTIVTTVYMVILTLVIATPIGVGGAIYLVEYAGEMSGSGSVMHRVVDVIRFAVETLAGVPSIIYGLFGFAFFVTALKLGLSMLSGALAGACLILPTIIRTTEEALLTVPRSYREGSLALGATKWQTNFQVVLPAALPGIVTGIILGVGRIISETAVFYVTLGGSINMPSSIMDQGRTMVLHLYSLMMDANAPDPAMGTAIVIVAVVVLINLAINFFSQRLAQRMRGSVS